MKKENKLKILPNETSKAELSNPSIRRVFVRNLVLNTMIGVHRHEKRQMQPVRINVDLNVMENPPPGLDTLEEVVDYEKIVDGIRAITSEAHINLLETLAEKVATLCLADKRVLVARIRVEKLRIIKDADSVGVEIERSQR